ncbi:MAG: DNA-binding protein [Clostridia bacterium]|nr:DNA-binding protein [Clostridia bacterium]
MFEKNMRLALLLDYYGNLLSEHRRTIMELYYCEDLSLAEIAENTGITRQAVRDSIKKSETELYRIDEALRLGDHLQSIQDKCADAADHIETLLSALPDGEAKTSLSQIIDEIRAIPS